jgi:ubiquinone/menaquinone biosynthesis C-methylase UbiE
MLRWLDKINGYSGERIDFDTVDAEALMQHIIRYEYAARHLFGRVLDCACGVGYGSYYLASRPLVTSVTGADISAEAIKYANHKFQHAKLMYRIVNALDMPFTDCSFDGVVSLETLEHLKKPERFLSEVMRVLRPGGIFIVSVPNRKFHADAGMKNEWHYSEMYYSEFKQLLSSFFSEVTMDYQLYSESRAQALLEAIRRPVPMKKKMVRATVPKPVRRLLLLPVQWRKYRSRISEQVSAKHDLDFDSFIRDNPELKASYRIVPADTSICELKMGNLISCCQKRPLGRDDQAGGSSGRAFRPG